MKKLFTLLLLIIPVFVMAQENLLGKSKAEVQDHFKKAGIPLYSSDVNGDNIANQYKTDNSPDVTCFFDKTNICKKVMDVEAFSSFAKFKSNFDRNWVKAGDNVWTNKAKTMKVRIVGVEALNQLYVMYVGFGKDFGNSR